jgi:protein-disulfide isomerase
MDESGKARDYLTPASILVAGILVSASILWGGGSSPREGGAPVALVGGAGVLPEGASGGSELTRAPTARDVVLGDPKAPVAFIEYGDYQCPFCGRVFTQVEPQLREEFIKTGEVKMVYRNFAFLGPESFAAAEAAECAKDQKQYWAYHDALFAVETVDNRENNGNLNRELFLKLAQDLNLDAAEFAECFDGKKYASLVQEDSQSARQVGVNSTPTVYINGELVRGALPYEQFKAIIERALQAGS